MKERQENDCDEGCDDDDDDDDADDDDEDDDDDDDEHNSANLVHNHAALFSPQHNVLFEQGGGVASRGHSR